MRITITLPSGKRLAADAHPQLYVYEILAELGEMNLLPPLPTINNPGYADTYGFFVSSKNPPLDSNKTLEGNGVEENDSLMVRRTLLEDG